ncbi:helix-turn-helix transcriptional regulator [Phytohabitans rumicis]|uniref:helix-turn-helix transcriptional regulator n=1 Tax=Phytohabitans rumicis TaxID=1076125 RepID=UPI001566E9D8|nr:LuxR C-terminal-related transcriptional regulator [Phytohabitans rumicis]
MRVALDELADLGLAQGIRQSLVYGADAAVWRAARADAAVATLRRRALRRAGAASAAEGGPAEAIPYPAMRLPDRQTSRRRIIELAAIERAEHLSMNPTQVLTVEDLAVGAPMDIAALRRGVRMRSLGRPPADGDRSAGHAIEFGRHGGEYRETPRLPHKLMIFDRRVALLSVDALDPDRGVWEIVDRAAVESLVTLFVRHWSDATDPRRNGVPGIVLTSREKAVVALLAEGHTDATAAQHLGMSIRSVTYTLRGLMDRLGVQNRFQLGLALGALHAATPPGLSTSEETGKERNEGYETGHGRVGRGRRHGARRGPGVGGQGRGRRRGAGLGDHPMLLRRDRPGRGDRGRRHDARGSPRLRRT